MWKLYDGNIFITIFSVILRYWDMKSDNNDSITSNTNLGLDNTAQIEKLMAKCGVGWETLAQKTRQLQWIIDAV